MPPSPGASRPMTSTSGSPRLTNRSTASPTKSFSSTDVLIWWGHCAHAEVRDDIVAKVLKRIHEGMGLIVLHSGHFSKIFKAVTGMLRLAQVA